MRPHALAGLPFVLSMVIASGVGCSRGSQAGPGEGDPDLAAAGSATDGPPAPGPDGASTSDLALPTAEGRPLWGRRYDNVTTVDVATAPDGSIYLTGHFLRTNFGDGEVSAAGSTDVFLIKMDRLGQQKWVRTFGRSYVDMPQRVTADKDGNVAIAGFSQRSSVPGSHDALIAIYSADGTQRSLRYLGSDKTNGATSIAYAPDGTLWVTGGFAARIDFGGGDLVSQGSSDMFLLHLGATGTHLLSKRFGFTGEDYGNAVSALPGGDVAIFGYGGHPIDFGDGNVGMDPDASAFLVRFSPLGVARWSKRLRLESYSNNSLTAGQDGTLWLLGDFIGSTDLGGGMLTPPGGRCVFWTRYSVTGAHLGSYLLPSTGPIYLTQGAVDSTGQIVLGGVAEGDVDFGGGLTTSAAGRAFFLKSSADGRLRWSLRFGGIDKDRVAGVAVLPGDQVVAGVQISKAISPGGVSLAAGGGVLTVTP